MEAAKINEENAESSGDKYGELNALLNELTASDSEARKSCMVSQTSELVVIDKHFDAPDLLDVASEPEKSKPENSEATADAPLDKDDTSNEDLTVETGENDESRADKTEEAPKDSVEAQPESLELESDKSVLSVDPPESRETLQPEEDTSPPPESDVAAETKDSDTEVLEKGDEPETQKSEESNETSPEESSKVPEQSQENESNTEKLTTGDVLPGSSGADVQEKSEKKASGVDESDILSLLQKLSPEKLEEIKSKIFNDQKQKNEEKQEEEKMEVDETPSAAPSDIESLKKFAAQVDDDDCVILLDSDEELPPVKKTVEAPAITPAAVTKEIPAKVYSPAAAPKRAIKEKSGKHEKTPKRTRECVNPDCPRSSDDFQESPLFVLSFYYTQRKNKTQYVCSSCFDKAVIKYEEMAEALLNNKPLSSVEIHKKHEMVEVIDSDDEDESGDAPKVSDSMKSSFGREEELEVEEILQDICNRVDIKKQIEWDRLALMKQMDKMESDNAGFEEELKELEKKSALMYNELYSINRPRIQQRPPLDITHELDNKQAAEHLRVYTPKQILPVKVPVGQPTPRYIATPGIGKIQISPRPAQPTQVTLSSHEQVYFAMRSNVLGRMQNWAPCKLLETITDSMGKKSFKVQFYDQQPPTVCLVRGKEFALNTVNHKLQIGARVIALFPRQPKKGSAKRYLPGVIGEKLSKYNNHRYLVFCDYGQVQYASPESVREVADASPQVWDDVHDNLKQFIKDYLQSKTQCQRALLNVRVNQRVTTERNNNWKVATVIEIDCSIIKMFFSEENISEWLYRGSKRLGPLFTQSQVRGMNFNARRNDPNITYIAIDDEMDQQLPSDQVEVKRNTARKSTAPTPQQKNPQQAVAQPGPSSTKTIILNDDNIYLEDPTKVTKLRHFTPRKEIAPKKYVVHECSPSCLSKQASSLAIYSPLTKPLLTCWERQIVRQKANRWVQYKAPCGRRLRNMYEIRDYLMITKSFLNVDNFDFNEDIQVLATFDVADKAACPLYIPDVAEGKEGMKIPAYNPFDDQAPPKLEYSASRIPMKGVNINTDPDFMACCDCTDDCADKLKCACFQMTIQGYKFANKGEDTPDEEVSYVWKRLLKQVPTGIYECHSRCKCTDRCLNKVVQRPIQVKMQLYRSKNRGWGLEGCHDIPKGTFICIYAGRLYTEDEANSLCQGLEHGDEYFAELDLIETATPLKEGYESGVVYDNSESEEEKPSDSDSDFNEKEADNDTNFTLYARSSEKREIVTRSTRSERLKKSQSKKKQNGSDSEDEMVSMEPKAMQENPKESPKTRSLRKLFGKNEKVYIMDAKTCGNVGRYFNHSCDPNLFVQSVFVDTHDMRFPWIAFYANRLIKAGEELTWNYNYEVGSVPSKVLYCKCGSKSCRGRIL